MRILKASKVWSFILSVLVVLAINIAVQAQQFDVSPPPIPNGYVPLSSVNSFIARDRQFRERIPETFVSRNFNAGERQLLEMAVQGSFGSFTSQSTDCVLKSAKTVEARSNWFSSWPAQVKPSLRESLQGVLQRPGIAVYRYWDKNKLRRTDVPMRLFINREFQSNIGRSGWAYVGTNIRNEGYQITLNMANFPFVPGGNWNTEAGKRIARQNVDTSKKMAGVILHEILHNVGYNHPDVVNGNFNPVEGTVPYVAQWCLVSLGKHSSAKTLIADRGTWLTGSPSWTDPGLYAD
jgi:hypothetical protein